jgi:hypothetical protein
VGFLLQQDNSRIQVTEIKFVGEGKLYNVQQKIDFPLRRKVLQLSCLYQQQLGLHLAVNATHSDNFYITESSVST